MTDSCYEQLSNAIVLQAVKDYRHTLRKLRKYPLKDSHRFVKEEVERFVRSEWFSMLTSIDGEMMLNKLRQEVEKYDS